MKTIIFTQDDEESDKRIEDEENCNFLQRYITNCKRKISNNIFIFVQFFSTLWVRCIIQNSYGTNKFLLDYGYNFLPYIGILSYIIFIITKIH